MCVAAVVLCFAREVCVDDSIPKVPSTVDVTLPNQLRAMENKPFTASPEGEAALPSSKISRGLALPPKRALPFYWEFLAYFTTNHGMVHHDSSCDSCAVRGIMLGQESMEGAIASARMPPGPPTPWGFDFWRILLGRFRPGRPR